jgi:hypothetical protein
MIDEGHNPRWLYDCDRCKFHWCCGPTCYCVLHDLPHPPPERQREVDRLTEEWRAKRGLGNGV